MNEVVVGGGDEMARSLAMKIRCGWWWNELNIIPPNQHPSSSLLVLAVPLILAFTSHTFTSHRRGGGEK